MQNKPLSIAVPTPLRSLFDYLPPADMPKKLEPGVRVHISFGSRQLVGIVVQYSEKEYTEEQYKKLKYINRVIDTQSVFNHDIWAMCLWAARYYHHPLGEVLFSALPSLLRSGINASKNTEDCFSLAEQAKNLPPESLKRAPKQQHCLDLLKQHKSIRAHQLANLGISRQTLKALKDKGLLDIQQKPIEYQQTLTDNHQTIELNQEQQKAYTHIAKHYNKPNTFLLDGITGSGKTEVYLACIKDMLAKQQQTLVIVPEINLTPQFVHRFEQRLAIKVPVLHSGLTDRQRLNAWVDAKTANAKVVIGTRSALFTPFKSLGLIIIDEEHASTLKQQTGFKYSARDCAIWRANHLNIPTVLGSATPSLESYINANDARYTPLLLTQRAGKAVLPKWHIHNIKGELLNSGISQKALLAISQTINQQKQVLVFINRLGYAPNLQCHQCGWHGECQLCDANMTVFLNKQQLRCSHCNNTQVLPRSCPVCHTSHLQTSGQGTEQVSRYLEQYFDTTPVIRIDSDTSQNKARYTDQLAQINTGQACIIVGTQIMAKGHDFSQLALVVVLNVDEGLVNANYRAIERTAQLLTQVAGRAGRSQQQGQVLIQSHYPEHPLFSQLQNNQYHSVLNAEKEQRQQLKLPPYSFEAQLLLSSKYPDQPDACLEELRHYYDWSCTLIGPLPAQLAKKAGSFRSTMVLRSVNRKTLHHNLQLLTSWLDTNAKRYKCRWMLDIDPQEAY